jgi:hypothetical protein
MRGDPKYEAAPRRALDQLKEWGLTEATPGGGRSSSHVANGARPGLIVSGDAATGKTTSIKQLGRLHELRVHARFPAGRDRIPVVYVTCHSAVGPQPSSSRKPTLSPT